MIKANNPTISTWLPTDKQTDFSIQNIPFGIFKPKNRTNPRVGTRIGKRVIDLAAIADKGYFKEEGIREKEIFHCDNLNAFMAMGKPTWREIRNKISDIFNEENEEIWNTPDFTEGIFHKPEEVELLLPVQIGDYTDFYSSIDHATNVGKMFRDPNNALLPNWKHLPVGYHGRASSIVVSGTNIHRPWGQIKPNANNPPVFSPTLQLDFELEMAFIVGKESQLGNRISTGRASDYIFGVVIFNDLSARDIQSWEYVPLGPFLSKNFGSVISPWVVTLDALEPFKTNGPVQEPPVLPYLRYEGDGHFDVHLDAYIEPENGKKHKLCRSNFKHLYWDMYQQLAHHTVNGCNVKTGDLMASGTISGPTPGSLGSMLEITWKGTKPVVMPDGSERKFINDFDTIIMKAFAEKDNVRVGFGELRTKILPAKEFK